jgi:DNA replication protein DnaC
MAPQTDIDPWDMGPEEAPRRIQATDYRPSGKPSGSATAPKPPPVTAASPTSPTDECPGCGGSGYYTLSVDVTHPQFGKLHRCECMAGKPTPKQVQALAQLHQDLGRYRGCTFTGFFTSPNRRPLSPIDWGGETIDEATQRMLLRRANDEAQTFAQEARGWLYLYGTFGGGKSHLAAAALNAAADRGIVGAYASAADLLRYIHDGFTDNSASGRLVALRSVDLLCLDDLKAEYLKPGSRSAETLWELLDPRYRQMLPTIITSNVHPDDLPDGRLASRIAELARICWLPISDYRRQR